MLCISRVPGSLFDLDKPASACMALCAQAVRLPLGRLHKPPLSFQLKAPSGCSSPVCHRFLPSPTYSRALPKVCTHPLLSKRTVPCCSQRRQDSEGVALFVATNHTRLQCCSDTLAAHQDLEMPSSKHMDARVLRAGSGPLPTRVKILRKEALHPWVSLA